VFRVHVHVVGHVSSTCITKSSEDLKSGKEDPFLRIFAAEKNKHDSEIVRTRPPKYYHPPAPSTFWYPLLCLSHLSPPPLLLCWPRQCLLTNSKSATSRPAASRKQRASKPSPSPADLHLRQLNDLIVDSQVIFFASNTLPTRPHCALKLALKTRPQTHPLRVPSTPFRPRPLNASTPGHALNAFALNALSKRPQRALTAPSNTSSTHPQMPPLRELPPSLQPCCECPLADAHSRRGRFRFRARRAVSRDDTQRRARAKATRRCVQDDAGGGSSQDILCNPSNYVARVYFISTS
jgi:hypothetical protein